MATDLVTYIVKLNTPMGIAELEVPSTLGPAAAGRRARWTAVALGYGDLDNVYVHSVREE